MTAISKTPTTCAAAPFTIRNADSWDLGAINDVIMRAVATWSVSARLIERIAPLFFVDVSTPE